VQDLGRPGHMHEGLAPGGALVPELLAAANSRVRNPIGAAAVEVMGMLTVRAESAVLVSTDDGPARTLSPGEELTVASGRRSVAYLAVRGGVDAPVVLGSRSTQLSAGIGALIRAGTSIDAAGAPEDAPDVEPFEESDIVRIVAGPDFEAFTPSALPTLVSQPYQVSPQMSRVGTRLSGPSLERSRFDDRSRPMIVGALEVPPDGQPIVLGPEHPTTGGYPVIGVIVQADRGRFFATPIGGTVRFVVVSEGR